jgi:putative hemolysin
MVFVIIEIVVIVLLITLNGYLSMAEMAIISARKVRLQQMVEDGRKNARTALELKTKPAHFLSTVQLGVTLIGILTGVFGGATITEEFTNLLNRVSWLQPYSHTISVTLIVILITFLTVIFGELAPKQIALQKKEKLATRVAPFMKFLSKVTSPFVHLLSRSTYLVLKIFKVKPSVEPEITEEDVKTMLEQGAADGIFEPLEEEMVQQVFRLGDKKVDELMTPRLDVVFLEVNDSENNIFNKMSTSGFSRFPLVEEGMDSVLGIVRAKDLLLQKMKSNLVDLKAALQPALFVPESTSVIKLLEDFREKRLHMAFIVDEYGSVLGIMTPTDIMEAIVGDMPEIQEPYEPEIIQREDGSWLLDGMLSVDELKELYNLKTLPQEEDDYQTLGGMIMTLLARVPNSGDSVDIGDLHFEVVDMDEHRVDKVLVTQNKPS